jgi:hypothetical protein
MKSLDRQSFEEQTRLVSRYVAGDLSRSERAEFEAWLVASPELASEVEMERRLRRGIASAARRGWLKRGSLQVATRDRPWRVAAAASLILSLTALGLNLVLPERSAEHQAASPQQSASSRAIAPARTVRLSAVRGLSSSPDISVAVNDAPGALIIEPDVVVLTCPDGSMNIECAGGAPPETTQYEEYELDVIARRGSTLTWRSAREVPVAGTPLSFTLQDPATLEAGDYDLIVRGHSSDHEEVVARFWLRVTAQ